MCINRLDNILSLKELLRNRQLISTYMYSHKILLRIHEIERNLKINHSICFTKEEIGATRDWVVQGHKTDVNTEARNSPGEGRNNINCVHICRNRIYMNFIIGSRTGQSPWGKAGICAMGLSKCRSWKFISTALIFCKDIN